MIDVAKRGITIVGFTREQVATHNVVQFKDANVSIEITDKFNPNEWSLEEAVVWKTHEDQTLYKTGDNVLIDFGVFTAGKHSQTESVDESRFVSKEGGLELYWLKDNLHPTDLAEIYARVNDKGKVYPFGDVVIIDRVQKDHLINTGGGILVPASMLSKRPFVAKVVAAPPESIVVAGDHILCEAGYSPTIKYRGIVIEYINYPYIIGVVRDGQLNLL